MDTKTISEDLMVDILETYYKLGALLSEANKSNEQNIDNEYREWNRDYERSITC